MDHEQKKNPRFGWLRVLIFFLIIAGAGFYLWYSNQNVPQKFRPAIPPQFSARYTYYFPPTNLTFAENSPNKQIDTDLQGIKDMGFDGITLSFIFKQSDAPPMHAAQKASKLGLQPIGTLVGHNAKPLDRAFTQDELIQWEAFVRSSVKSTRNTIFYWEIWNEPAMIALFRYGTPAEFIDLLKATTPIIRQENPEALIIVTLDESDREAAEFTTQAMDLGAGNYFDILSFHPYSADPYIQTDAVIEKIAKEKALDEKYGNFWPLWISEIGQPTSEVGEDRQAELAQFMFETAKKEGIPISWLTYTDQRLTSGATIGGKSGWGFIDQVGNKRKSYEVIKNFLSQQKN